MNELALFAGAGGGILAGHLLGWNTVCAVERDAYAAQILAQRQNDGCLRPFPIWSDVCSFDGRPWQGIIDVVSGGFPCQDISAAGSGIGIDGKRSGLWAEMARIIGEVRPNFVFVENSPMLRTRGLAVVVSDLAKMGYSSEWVRLSASDTGASHKRDRYWIVAHSTGKRQQRPREPVHACNTEANCDRETSKFINVRFSQEWPTEPALGRVADGVAYRMDRLKAIGNGQVPRVAAAAFAMLSENKSVD